MASARLAGVPQASRLCLAVQRGAEVLDATQTQVMMRPSQAVVAVSCRACALIYGVVSAARATAPFCASP